MKTYRISVFLQIFLFLFALTLIIYVRNRQITSPETHSLSEITEVTVQTEGTIEKKITLPHLVKGLPPETLLRITATFVPKANDVLFLKTVSSSAKVYLDEELVYEFGNKTNYPDFMTDPATELCIITPDTDQKERTLRIDYLSPVAGNSFYIYPPVIGTYKAIWGMVTKENFLPFLLSVMQISFGIFLIINAGILLYFKKNIGKMLFHLGIFSFLGGLWTFGECNLTGLLIKKPTMLYLFAIIGRFTLIIPLLYFSLEAIEFQNKRRIAFLANFFLLFNITVLLLQLTGLVPFAKSMDVFHILAPLSLCFLAGNTVFDAIRYKSQSAKRYTVPMIILAVSAVVEAIHSQSSTIVPFSYPFQYGMILFVIVMGTTIGFYIRDITLLQCKHENLTTKMRIIEAGLTEQRKYNTLIAKNEENLKKQQHDLRHHLIVIKGLAKEQIPALNQYLNTLIDDLPEFPKTFCENKVVNSILSHYGTILAGENIAFEYHLMIPQIESTVMNSDLCIIFGNLIENALEACRRMEQGKKFIKLKSKFQYGTLIITMDNSFNGKATQINDRFLSEKRNDVGIGLSSIKQVAIKHDGNAVFEKNGEVFLSSVYLKIEE